MSKKPKTQQCVACGEQHPRAMLVPLVADRAGGLVVDLKGQLGGPGVFVCPDRRCLDRLQADGLARALGVDSLDAQAIAALPDLIRGAFAARVKSLLAMAQGSGNLISGSSAARAALRRAPPSGWLAIIAEDASPDIARQLGRLVQACGVTLARGLTIAELGDSIGKSPRSIVVIKDFGLAGSVQETLSRLEAVGA